MKLTEPITIQSTRVIGVICDCCGLKKESNGIPNGWHEFSSGHSGWGNDSYESIETITVCSPLCYIKKLKQEADRVSNMKHHGANVGDYDAYFAIDFCNFLMDNGL